MGKDRNPYYKEQYDLQNCEAEPIHRIQRSQNYGSYISCDHQATVWFHASEDILGQLKSESISSLLLKRTGVDFATINPKSGKQFFTKPNFDESLIVHPFDKGYKIEIEPSKNKSKANQATQPDLNSIMGLSSANTQDSLINEVIKLVYESTQYDHIMIYKFDDNYVGEVIAEKCQNGLPPYLGLKFPASDIPEQARKLYFSQKIRIIHDSQSDGDVIISNSEIDDMVPLDLTDVTIRGVSPIHREYLGNMGVRSSFSVAIIIKNKLWGLIACHNKETSFINHPTRKWLIFLCDYISSNWNKLVKHESDLKILSGQLIHHNLMEKLLASKDLFEGLLYGDSKILSIVSADGVIVKSKDKIKGIGSVPEPHILKGLGVWLEEKGDFDTESFEKAKDILPIHLQSPLMAGMLILQISEFSHDYIIWLRKEKLIKTHWAGKQENTKSFNEDKERISPRKSFEKWKTIEHGTAESWSNTDLLIAKRLKEEIKDQLYKKYDEVVLLNKELNEAYKQMEAFSYSVSHDLTAPLRSIDGFSKILVNDYSTSLDDQGLHLLNRIVQSAAKMKVFIHEMLNYSKVNKRLLNPVEVELNNIIQEQWEVLADQSDPIPILIFEKDLPLVYGDKIMISQLIMNILSNSIKYVDHGKTPKINITHERINGYLKLIIEDNGIGIPKNKRSVVFNVFKRLVPPEKYDGSGIGLSIVKKVIERHGGEIDIFDTTIDSTGIRIELTLPSNIEFIELINKRNKEN